MHCKLNVRHLIGRSSEAVVASIQSFSDAFGLKVVLAADRFPVAVRRLTSQMKNDKHQRLQIDSSAD